MANIKPLLLFLVTFLFQRSTLAQTCWKNTTCSGPAEATFPGPWDAGIYAPASRTVLPKSILSLETKKIISSYPGKAGTAKLSGNGSALVFDFGIEVGGLVTFNYTATGNGAVRIFLQNTPLVVLR